MPRVRTAGLAHGGECLGQQVVQVLAVLQALAELPRSGPRSSSSERACMDGSEVVDLG